MLAQEPSLSIGRKINKCEWIQALETCLKRFSISSLFSVCAVHVVPRPCVSQQQADTTIALLLPKHIGSIAKLWNYVHTPLISLLCLDRSSRFVWQQVQPCLFGTTAKKQRVAYYMIQCLYNNLQKFHRVYDMDVRDSLSWMNQKDPFNDDVRSTSYFTRKLVTKSRKQSRDAIKKYPPRYTVIILPPTISILEYSWEERLIHLEHNLIRAQSMAGLYSTLGGGYFMTRRLQTATKLAKEQMRLAVVLGNKEMYYKCIINQAYNEIYRGSFRAAKRHILQAWVALAYEKHFEEKIVLQNM